MKLLEGKSAVITGTGSGVGRASALLFAQHGASVVCADIQEEWNEETVGMIAAEAGSATAVRCDVRKADEVSAAVAAAVDTYGRLDVMFNNAGISSSRRPMLVEDHDDDEFNRLVEVNARGVFFGCRAAVTQMKRQGGGGAIVNTGSIAGMVALGSVIYGGTKAMIIQMTRAIAIEVAPDGIRANCICPGGMTTRFSLQPHELDRERTAEELELARGMHPLNQPITPEDCAWAAVYLASDVAKNVTGVALPIDGGYVAR